jgi:hypothetical protein
VIFIHSHWFTAQMEGIDQKLSRHLGHFAYKLLSGLWLFAEMESTSFIQHWRGVIRALAPLLTVYGPLTPMSM